MRQRVLIASLAAVLLSGFPVSGSGPIGLYGIVERVIFEPDEARAERVQVWGAFAFVEGGGGSLDVSPPARGYLYFRLPPASSGTAAPGAALIRREWADLKAVAGTGRAIGFGQWGYIGSFAGLRPDARSRNPPYVIERAPYGGTQTDLRVRPASEPPAAPVTYQTNAGIAELPEHGSHAEIVRALREAFRE